MYFFSNITLQQKDRYLSLQKTQKKKNQNTEVVVSSISVPFPPSSAAVTSSTDSVVVGSSLPIGCSIVSSAASFESLFLFCGFWLILQQTLATCFKNVQVLFWFRRGISLKFA